MYWCNLLKGVLPKKSALNEFQVPQHLVQPPPPHLNVSTEDLVLGNTAAQSSTNKGQDAALAVDNTDTTCTQTRPDQVTWWEGVMEEDYVVHTVVVKTGLAFGCKICIKINM